MPTITERLVKSRVKLLRESPFFGTLLLNAKCVVTDSIPTAATDGDILMLNEDFMQAQSQPHFQSILLHEVLHMALEHVERLKGPFTADPLTANIAADIVVNGIIQDNHLPLPEEATTDNELKHLSVMEIYSILKQKQQQNPNHLQDTYGSKGNQCLQPNKKPNGGGGGDNKENGTSSGVGGSRGEKTNWKDVLNKAKTIAKTKSYGLQGAGLKRIFDDLLEPTINWRDALYKYITTARTDFEAYDRRFIHTGQYLDDLGGGKIKVAVFMDTSGSVDEKLLGEFIAELRFAINSMPNISGEMWYFDTELYPQGDIEEVLGTPRLQGGGGTSFEKPLRKMQKFAEDDGTTQVLGLIFTDGYANLKDLPIPECPVMWCISPGGVENEHIKFGEVVRITH